MRVAAAVLALLVAVLLTPARAPAELTAASGAVTGPVASGAVRPVDGEVLRGFDPPSTPYGRGHRGVDLAAPPGTSVRAALSGTVTFAGPVAGRGWVTVSHGGGLDTTYGWVEPRAVTRGQRVRAGQVLGRTAPEAAHLDWGARLHGSYIDPMTLLGGWRARLVAL